MRRQAERLLLQFVVQVQFMGHELPMYAYGPPAEVDQRQAPDRMPPLLEAAEDEVSPTHVKLALIATR